MHGISTGNSSRSTEEGHSKEGARDASAPARCQVASFERPREPKAVSCAASAVCVPHRARKRSRDPPASVRRPIDKARGPFEQYTSLKKGDQKGNQALSRHEHLPREFRVRTLIQWKDLAPLLYRVNTSLNTTQCIQHSVVIHGYHKSQYIGYTVCMT